MARPLLGRVPNGESKPMARLFYMSLPGVGDVPALPDWEAHRRALGVRPSDEPVTWLTIGSISASDGGPIVASYT